MHDTFTALVVDKGSAGQTASFKPMAKSALDAGDVLIRVTHTTINYKDGLALSGKSPILRKFPMIPGIDFAGYVEASSDPRFNLGDDVILNGWGVGESHFGGYSQYARVKGDWLVKRPHGFSRAQTMAIGTAGYTSALSLMALDDHGITPADGAVLVTGAAGGVGSVAVALLKKRGFHVIASTGRPEEADFLTGLGAAQIIPRAELSSPVTRPLAKERWVAAIDVAGSHTLANVLAQTASEGIVAATGLAQGMDLATSVAPFILRGVTLRGINSVTASLARRQRAWDLLSRDLDTAVLDGLTQTRPLADVLELAPKILAGQIRGRVVLEVA